MLNMKRRARDPKNAQAWFHLGLLQLEAGDKASAREALAKASALRPGDKEIAAAIEKAK